MKKNYTVGLLTFLLSITLYAQDVVFDFETDQNLLGWVEGLQPNLINFDLFQNQTQHLGHKVLYLIKRLVNLQCNFFS